MLLLLSGLTQPNSAVVDHPIIPTDTLGCYTLVHCFNVFLKKPGALNTFILKVLTNVLVNIILSNQIGKTALIIQQ